MDMMVTTGAIRCLKLWSNHRHQQTGIQLFTGRMPFMSPSQQCQSSEGKTSITFHRLVQPKLTWGLATLSVTTKGSWLSWGGLSCRFVSPLMPEIVRMKQMPDNISSHMEYEGAPPISNANDRAVKVLQFHFRFSFAQKTAVSFFPGFGFTWNMGKANH